MFNISAKADYGLIIMLELAKNHGQGYLAMSDISTAKNLSSHYLTQITKPLREAKLLASKEGKTGGYTLSRKPEEITILEILEALEGKIKLNRHDCSSICAAFANCEAKTIWPSIMMEIKKLLAKKTLADLLNK
ncbi:Rrf2 family transcriptional regulator [bacterium]|jgi:Rrf2 family cysteine metabolism transcriptional repressor|nr:Rrf2 family transcriptional regulator [bacterium]